MATGRTLIFLFLSTCTFTACRGCGYGAEDAAAGSPPSAARATESGAVNTAAASLSPTALAIPDGPWTDLARRLTSAQSLADAVTVTRDVLARGGVATFDGERAVVPAVAPHAGFSATPRETVHLAMEARRRRTAATMTAAELAQMLETFGWPFRNGTPDGGDASEPMRRQMAEDLQEAARASRSSERDAESTAAEAAEAEREAARKTAMERDAELVRRIQDATLVWQKARQAAAKAPPDARAAAEAQVKEAWDARQALIDERRRAQEQARTEERDRRDRRIAASADARRLEAVRRRIGPDYRAGEQLMEMLALWVRAAAEDPNDPRNFTPLFLAEMARLQDPPLDLAGSHFTRPGRGDGPPVDLRGAPRSQQLRLTLLEIQLIAAAFHRTPDATPALHRRPSFLLDVLAGLDGVVLAAQDPCSQFKESLGKLVSQKTSSADAGTAAAEVAGAVASEGAGRAIDAAAGAALSSADAAAFGKAMSALGMAAKIGKLVSFYEHNRVTVTPEPLSTHKPPEGQDLVTYTATAGIDEEDWKEYEQALNAEGGTGDAALRDCMNSLGLPTPSEVSELAKEAENWLVEWRLSDGAPPHAWITLRNNDFYLPGRLAMKLKRSGPYSASAKLVVDILPESQRTGKVVRAYVTARASVDAAGMPGLGTLVNVFKGVLGVADSVLELCVGWYQFMNMPKAYGTVEVEYHCPKPTTLVPSSNAVADGGGDDGPNDCLIEAGSGR